MKETELFEPVRNFFKNKGFKVYSEVPVSYRGVDIVAVKGKKQIAIELKVSFTKKLVYQAHHNQWNFPYSMCAVPTKPRRNTMQWRWCEEEGIGILRILKNGEVKVLLPVVKKKTKTESYDFSGFKEGSIAGCPTQAGVSMPGSVALRIKAYVKKHPFADWAEIFEKVTHHYASKYSLKHCVESYGGLNLEKFRLTLKNNKYLNEVTEEFKNDPRSLFNERMMGDWDYQDSNQLER